MKRALSCIIIVFTVFMANSQSSKFCDFMEAGTVGKINIDSTIFSKNREAKFDFPQGWEGKAELFKPLQSIRLVKGITDSSGIGLSGRCIWLVQDYEEFVSEIQSDTNIDFCLIKVENFTCLIYQKEEWPIEIIYEQSNSENSGWTWFLKIYAKAPLNNELMREIKHMIVQLRN